MSLSKDEAEDLKEIITQLYGRDITMGRPTQETLELVEEMLLGMQECSKKVSKLLATLNCSMIGRGFLARCLRGMRNLVRDNKEVFVACLAESLRSYRTAITASTI